MNKIIISVYCAKDIIGIKKKGLAIDNYNLDSSSGSTKYNSSC